MILGILLLLLAGIALSAFFSGSETGFYRAPRMRLVIDSVGGDVVSQWLLWLTARPSLFVATSLLGTNVANYLVSLATVIAIHEYFSNWGATAELLIPVVLSPILFVFGELVPKHFFFHSPSRMLRAAGPIFLFCTALFLPVTALLWIAGKLLEWLLGESPQVVKRRLARAELKRAIDEGHEAGILRPAQRLMAQGLFAVARLTVRDAMTPTARVPVIHAGMPKEAVLRLARRQRLSAVAVLSQQMPRVPIGYVEIMDLYVDKNKELGPIRPMPSLPATEPHITALVRLEGSGAAMARVVDRFNRTLGYVTPRQLTEPLLRDGT